MKPLYRTAIGLMLFGSLITACNDDEKEPRQSEPVIENYSITPVTATYGDSITLTAKVSDEVTPLSTLEVQMVLNDELLSKTSIRTKGNLVNVSKKFYVPFAANAVDNAPLECSLKLINVDGYEANAEITNVVVKRPVFTALYLVMEDGTVLTMNPTSGNKDIFEAPYVSSLNSFKVKIAQKMSGSTIDGSGFVWANISNQLVLATTLDGFYQVSDVTVTGMEKFVFNAKTFALTLDGSRDVPITIKGTTLEAGAGGYLTANVAFTQGQTVAVTGIENMATSLNPDFFAVNGNVVTFLGLSGTYKLMYKKEVSYLYVEQPAAVYPDGMWICGVGLGRPFAPFVKTTGWRWDYPVDYVFCRKISNGVFQATVYLKHEAGKNWDDEVGFKYFHQRGWGGEESALNFTMPAGFVAKSGGDWGGTVDLPEGVYRLTLNKNDGSFTAEKLP